MNFFNHPTHKKFTHPSLLMIISIFINNNHPLMHLNFYYSPLTTKPTNLNSPLNFQPHLNEHTTNIYQLYFYTIDITAKHPSSINQLHIITNQ